MPGFLLFPLIIKGITVVGAFAATDGAMKILDAKDTINKATDQSNRNIDKYNIEFEATNNCINMLNKKELEIVNSFKDFSDIFEKIKNRPKFEKYNKNGFELPEYDYEKLKKISVGAELILTNLSGTMFGLTCGGIADIAINAASLRYGKYFKGNSIGALNLSSLSKIANPMFFGPSVIGVSQFPTMATAVSSVLSTGTGIFGGGLFVNHIGRKKLEKADEAWSQMQKAEGKINAICKYLIDLRDTAIDYYKTLIKVDNIYRDHLKKLKDIVIVNGNNDWNSFSSEEKVLTENSVLLVGLLYNMCKVELVLRGENDDDINTINKEAISKSIGNAKEVLEDRFSEV